MIERAVCYGFVLCCCLPFSLNAETRLFKAYDYDPAGNIVGVETEISENSPQVSGLTPSIVRIGERFSLTAEGSDLRGAQISPQDQTVTISNVRSTSTRINFDLTASNQTSLGDYTLTFTTPLGSTTATLLMQPRQPTLIIAPSPLAIAPGNTQTLDIRFSSADVFINTLTFSTSDTAVISISPSSVTVAQGDTVPDRTVTVTALSAGTATLSIDASTLTKERSQNNSYN